MGGSTKLVGVTEPCGTLQCRGSVAICPIDEARRQWTAHWGEDATAAMGAVTSVMRVQQILLALLEPFGLRFARYEALMILFYRSPGLAATGQDGRSAAARVRRLHRGPVL